MPRLSLEKLVSIWNSQNPADPIRAGPTTPAKRLWRELQRRLHPTCGPWGSGSNPTGSNPSGSGSNPMGKRHVEMCWAEKLAPSMKNDHFRPQAPSEWKKNRSSWLSNFDIANVLQQYERGHRDFSFLGVFPIDFNEQGIFGKCLYDEMCKALVPGLLEQKKRWVGAVFNLDRHDQSGSHWISLMVCMDPKHPAYGANFYDSTGRRAPANVRKFMAALKAQMPAAYPALPMRESRVEHQRENTECGMFSILFQVMFLETKNLSLDHFEALPLRDEHANRMRDLVFRI